MYSSLDPGVIACAVIKPMVKSWVYHHFYAGAVLGGGFNNVTAKQQAENAAWSMHIWQSSYHAQWTDWISEEMDGMKLWWWSTACIYSSSHAVAVLYLVSATTQCLLRCWSCSCTAVSAWYKWSVTGLLNCDCGHWAIYGCDVLLL